MLIEYSEFDQKKSGYNSLSKVQVYALVHICCLSALNAVWNTRYIPKRTAVIYATIKLCYLYEFNNWPAQNELSIDMTDSSGLKRDTLSESLAADKNKVSMMQHSLL